MLVVNKTKTEKKNSQRNVTNVRCDEYSKMLLIVDFVFYVFPFLCYLINNDDKK